MAEPNPGPSGLQKGKRPGWTLTPAEEGMHMTSSYRLNLTLLQCTQLRDMEDKGLFGEK